MPPRPILKYPETPLTQRAGEVERFDADLRDLADDLVETMGRAGGVGLAANQIGELRRVIAVDPSAGREPGGLRVLVNPTLLDQTGEVRAEEGCLSFPGIVEVVPRPARVMVRAQNLAGEPFDLPAEGLLARILHHEIDHLDGVLFLERMSPLKRRWVLQRIHKRIRAGTW